MRDEIAQLAKALEPSFTAREDAELAATMMVMALRYEFGQLATEVDQLRYRAALERLPKDSTATPRVVFVSPYDQKTDPHWRVTFTVARHATKAHGALARWLMQRLLCRTSWRDCGERSIDPDWLPAHQRCASTTLPNSTRSPSPVVLTSLPLCVAIFASISSARIAFRAWRVPLSSAPISP